MAEPSVLTLDVGWARTQAVSVAGRVPQFQVIWLWGFPGPEFGRTQASIPEKIL